MAKLYHPLQESYSPASYQKQGANTFRLASKNFQGDSSQEESNLGENQGTNRVLGDTVAVIQRGNKNAFLHSYTSLWFGWKAAIAFADNGKKFPFIPKGSDVWVYRAWLLLMNPEKYGDATFADTIRTAWDIRYNPTYTATRDVFESTLISHDVTVKKVAEKIGMPVDIVECYEVLFFNVIDRQSDYMFLRNVVYPKGRYEEMIEDYFQKGNLGKILLRQGYNGSLESVLHFAGFRNGYTSNLSTERTADMFQQQLMVNAYVMAANGFLNMDRAHTTVNSARQLLQASKLGGEGIDDSDQFAELGTSMRNQLIEDANWTRSIIENPRLES